MGGGTKVPKFALLQVSLLVLEFDIKMLIPTRETRVLIPISQYLLVGSSAMFPKTSHQSAIVAVALVICVVSLFVSALPGNLVVILAPFSPL